MGYTVMVVDDSETIRQVLERTLALTKLPVDAVLHASNGKQALELLQHQWVDIVFTDINMPLMNGVELIQKMKNSAEYMAIPTVVVSTEGSVTRIEELKQLGICGYLRKPFTPESIRDIIIDTLGGWNE
jgi:two-component system chemotaxis response regulator CheY